MLWDINKIHLHMKIFTIKIKSNLPYLFGIALIFFVTNLSAQNLVLTCKVKQTVTNLDDGKVEVDWHNWDYQFINGKKVMYFDDNDKPIFDNLDYIWTDNQIKIKPFEIQSMKFIHFSINRRSGQFYQLAISKRFNLEFMEIGKCIPQTKQF